MIDVTGSRSEIVYEALPTDDPQVRQPDISLARELLGWEPTVELREGLRRTLDEAGAAALTGTCPPDVIEGGQPSALDQDHAPAPANKPRDIPALPR